MVDGYAWVHFPRNTHCLPQPTGDAKWQSMVSAWLGVRFSFFNQGRSDAERDGEKENRMQLNAGCLDQKNPIHSVNLYSALCSLRCVVGVTLTCAVPKSDRLDPLSVLR